MSAAAEAGNIRAEADYVRWQSQFARISQLVAGGSLDRKLEDETRDSLKAAKAAEGEVRAKVEAAKADPAAKPGGGGQGQGQRGRGPRPPRQRGSRCGARENDAPVHANPRPLCGRRDRAQREPRRFRAAGQHDQRQAAADRRPHRYGPHLRGCAGNGVPAGRDGPDRLRQRAGPARANRGRQSDAHQLGCGPNRTLRTELDLPNPTGCCGRACTPRPISCWSNVPMYTFCRPLPSWAATSRRFAGRCRTAARAKTPLVLGVKVGDDVEVLSGLTGTEMVVQAHGETLQEGQPVELGPPGGK